MKEEYMRYAIRLAKKAIGYTSPNPLVGAVIVKNDEIVSTGYHEKYAQPHAERNAINNCTKENLINSTMYVTLEPCCHTGKTGPCTKAIINSRIRKVVIGSNDPNPKVAGKGIKELKDAGIEVVTGFLKKECDEINKIFFHYIKNNTPYIALKYAMTLDGKIATYTGKSKWITNEKARNHVHFLRHKYSSILVGINTVNKDNPMLNCTLENGKNPTRIILDSSLSIKENSNIVKTAKDIKTIIAYCNENKEKESILKSNNILLLKTKKDTNNQVDLIDLIEKLGSMKIDSILVEGGGTINDSFVRNKLVNKLYVYIGNKIFGGKDAKTPVEGVGIKEVKESLILENPKITTFDSNILLEYELKEEN